MRNAIWYSGFAKAAAHFCGRPRVFVLAVGVIAAWIVTGPIFGFSDTWQPKPLWTALKRGISTFLPNYLAAAIIAQK